MQTHKMQQVINSL